jgi:hypothetical protein
MTILGAEIHITTMLIRAILFVRHFVSEQGMVWHLISIGKDKFKNI